MGMTDECQAVKAIPPSIIVKPSGMAVEEVCIGYLGREVLHVRRVIDRVEQRGGRFVPREVDLPSVLLFTGRHFAFLAIR